MREQDSQMHVGLVMPTHQAPCAWIQKVSPGRQCLSMHAGKMRKIIRGIIFDMDGTCTEPVINFEEMRRRAGILEGDILGTLDLLPTGKRQEALQAVEEVEREALPRMRLMPGLNDLCEWLDGQQIPRGIITRNGQMSVDYFHKHHFKAQAFSPALCRDFRPYKPSPAGILHICQTWGIAPADCMMVGDSAKDDVVSGNRAGAVTVLLDHQNELRANPAQELRPQLVVTSLQELQDVLISQFQLQSPE